VSDLRQQILSTAKILFIQQGYHGMSMRQIAEALGVSKAALYYHFHDKEELLLAILDSFLDEMETALERIRQEQIGAWRQIQALVELILFQPADQRAVIRLSSQEMAQLSLPARQAFDRAYHRKFIDPIRLILQEGIQSGELRPVDPAVATWALLGMMYPYFYPAHSSDLLPPAEVAERLANIFLDGVARPSSG
jgi:TetR/AcrR family transcriptional regulator, cholesterol catabolism regulator